MAITWYGFDNADLTEAGHAELARRQGFLSWYHGMSAHPQLSTNNLARSVTMTSFGAMFPGIYADSSINETLTHDAHSTVGSRVDYGVLTANWSTNTVYLEVLKGTGTTGTFPALTQDAGVLWQMPIYRAGITSTTFAVDRCYPEPRKEQVTQGYVQTSTSTTAGETRILGSIIVQDPGWAYSVDVHAQVGFLRNVYGGHGLLRVVDSTGYELITTVSPALNLTTYTGSHNVGLSCTSRTYLGRRSFTLQMASLNMSAGQLSTTSGYSLFSLRRVPA